MQQDNFYNYCLSESARRDGELDIERVRYTVEPCLLNTLINWLRPQGVFTGLDPEDEHPDALPRIQRRIKEYGTSFSERAQSIVQGLQTHPDLDCRFLGIRLSFSDFYRSKKEQQLQQKS